MKTYSILDEQLKLLKRICVDTSISNEILHFFKKFSEVKGNE